MHPPAIVPFAQLTQGNADRDGLGDGGSDGPPGLEGGSAQRSSVGLFHVHDRGSALDRCFRLFGRPNTDQQAGNLRSVSVGGLNGLLLDGETADAVEPELLLLPVDVAECD